MIRTVSAMRTAITGKVPMRGAAVRAVRQNLRKQADTEQEGPENGRSAGEEREKGAECVRTAPETQPPRAAREEPERGRQQEALLSVPATAALRTAIKAAREKDTEVAGAVFPEWIGERKSFSL